MACRRASEHDKAYNRALSKRIAHAIHARGWTYKKCGDALGVSENTVYRWTEKKNPTTPRLSTLAKLCVVLGMDANDLLGIRGRK